MGRPRRLLRILLNAATAASLVLCLALIVLWWRSFRTGDALFLTHHTLRDGTLRLHSYSAAIGNGVLRCSEMNITTDADWLVGRRLRGMEEEEPRQHLGWAVRIDALDPAFAAGTGVRSYDREWKALGIGVFSVIDRYTRANPDDPSAPVAHDVHRRRHVGIRFRTLLVGAGVLPVFRLTWSFWRRRRGTRPGHCSACGYDLRAMPGRCPECGTIPAR